jgi:hypothetical protein
LDIIDITDPIDRSRDLRHTKTNHGQQLVVAVPNSKVVQILGAHQPTVINFQQKYQ